MNLTFYSSNEALKNISCGVKSLICLSSYPASACVIAVYFVLKKCVYQTTKLWYKMKCVIIPLWNWVKLKIVYNGF